MTRFAIVLVLSISWFVMSDRCALATVVASAGERPHSCCQEDKAAAKSPGNEQGAGECCKTLDATFVAVGKQLTDLSASFALYPNFTGLVVFPDTSGFMPLAIELDTGPPFASSFAEAVLQRSILAHAPPQLV